MTLNGVIELSDAAPTMWENLLDCEVRMIDAGGVPTRILTAGSGSPLLLLHGTGGHVEAWAKNVSVLARRHRVIAVDMVGHGLSGKPDIAYNPPDYAGHVRSVMDALQIESAHFAGVSLGAWVASWLALESPERVLSIVNCTGAVFRWPEGQAAKESTERRNMADTSAALAELTEQSVRNRLHLLFHDPSLCPEELVRIRLDLYSRPDARRVTARLHHLLPYNDPDRIAYSLTPERLRSLVPPVLYLWGQYNPGGSVEGGRRAAEITPLGDFEVIDGVGHWPQFEGATEFNRLVTNFLDRVDSTREEAMA
jgi:pimeloyl-ACP methyl ester carboxylesterase